MTDAKIEDYRQRLNTSTAQCSDEKPEGRIHKELKDLAREVGASTRVLWVHPTSSTIKTSDAETPELIRNIHQALQTASMVNMCRTATEGYEIATEASKSAARASTRASIQFWFAALVALASMAAAWVAAIAAIRN